MDEQSISQVQVPLTWVPTFLHHSLQFFFLLFKMGNEVTTILPQSLTLEENQTDGSLHEDHLWACHRVILSDTYSLIIWGCLKSFKFWISLLILPTTSRFLILCLLRIFTATLWPVSWWTATEINKINSQTFTNISLDLYNCSL